MTLKEFKKEKAYLFETANRVKYFNNEGNRVRPKNDMEVVDNGTEIDFEKRTTTLEIFLSC